jgi:hypothetical protein
MRTNKIAPTDLTEPLLSKQEIADLLGATVRFADKRVSDLSIGQGEVGCALHDGARKRSWPLSVIMG